jgi:predicted transcriptional regulator
MNLIERKNMPNIAKGYASVTKREIVMISPDTQKKLVRTAKKLRVSKSSIIRAALEQYFASMEEKQS